MGIIKFDLATWCRTFLPPQDPIGDTNIDISLNDLGTAGPLSEIGLRIALFKFRFGSFVIQIRLPAPAPKFSISL